MKAMEQLQKQCILGTGQHPPQPLETSDEQLQQLLDASQSLGAEQQVLTAAAILPGYVEAGQSIWQNASPLEPCERETLDYCSDKTASLLKASLIDEDDTFMWQLFERLMEAGQVLQPDLLTGILTLTCKDHERQDLMRQVMGMRGRWLCSLNPMWTLADSTGADWLEHQGADRKVRLKRARRVDAKAALESVEPVWSKEPARERQNMLEALAEGLCQSDLPFLQGLEKDRSQGVKALAAKMRLQLGDATLNKALIASVIELFQPPGTVNLPAQFNPDWKVWGIEEKAQSWHSGTKLGQKASWLYALLTLLDPVELATTLGRSLEDLLRDVQQSNNKAMLLAMDEAAGTCANVAYLNVRWQLQPDKEKQPWLQQNNNGYPSAALEGLVLELLNNHDNDKAPFNSNALEPVVMLGAKLSGPLSLELSCKALSVIKRQMPKQTKRHWQLTYSLNALGFYLDLSKSQHIIDTLGAIEDPMLQLQTLLTCYQQRVALHKELQP